MFLVKLSMLPVNSNFIATFTLVRRDLTVLKGVTRCSDVAAIVGNMTELQFMVASGDINAEC